ncbi:MAG: HAMP domain-containing sensor histidine kinase [Bacteroidota bacterium]|nr:HAMP domain-containing sensor histidine kinase [Bacteroidota bacterium]
MFNTIRSKLLAIFLLFVLITVITSVIIFNYFEKNKDSLSNITQNAESTHILLLKDIKVTHEFFENETINPVFFETRNSNLINTHNKICNNIEQALNDLNTLQDQNNFGLNDSIIDLKIAFSKYKVLTAEMFRQILIRGFKDYGIEGNMRNFAHDLENFQAEIGLVNILQLRRHEKDFIIRQEEPYIDKHNKLIHKIKDDLAIKHNISPDKKSKIIKMLNNYSIEFNNLTVYEKRLGLKNGLGLKKQIDDISNKIEISLATLVEFSAQKEKLALAHIKIVFLTIGFIFILIGIFSALTISKKVSSSITHLKQKIDEFVKSDFTTRTILPINNSSYEIDVLATNFSIMEQHIVNQMTSLKVSNKDLEMLFYATSHDIRNPLIKVKELTNDALAKTSDPGAKEYLLQINQSWEKLITTTDELGIITNVRSEEIKPELINLDELIRSVYSELRSLMHFDDIIFSLEIKTKNQFFSSPGLVKAIFRNLMENSIKYAVKRSSFSFLKISVVDQNDDMLRIEVLDNGIGINKQYHDRVFDMFFRGTSLANGTGLGLYIVKCSVEKLHGAIGLESDESTGTTFTVLLPTNYKKKNVKEQILHNREISELTNLTLN